MRDKPLDRRTSNLLTAALATVNLLGAPMPAGARQSRPAEITEAGVKASVAAVAKAAKDGRLDGFMDDGHVKDGAAVVAAPYRGADAAPGDLIVQIGKPLAAAKSGGQDFPMETQISIITGHSAHSGVTLTATKGGQPAIVDLPYPLPMASVPGKLEAGLPPVSPANAKELRRLEGIARGVMPIIASMTFNSKPAAIKPLKPPMP